MTEGGKGGIIAVFGRTVVAMRAQIHNGMTLDAIMRRWPATMRVMIDHGLLCVGCPVAAFHTVADAAREHGVDEVALSRDLSEVIDAAERKRSPPIRILRKGQSFSF